MFGALTSSFSASGLLGAATPDDPPPKKAPPRKYSYAPTPLNYLSRAAISLEYASLRYQSHCPLGMYVIPFAEDPSIWDATLFIHQGESHGIHLRILVLKNYGPRLLHRLNPKVSFDVSP